jgi:hypothetical protein
MIEESGKGNSSSNTIHFIENWLEKTLTESFQYDFQDVDRFQGKTTSTINKNRTAIEKLRMDRESLKSLGLEKKSQDKVYRSFFVYCHGVFEFMNEYKCYHEDLPLVLWGTFLRLFQFYDPKTKAEYERFQQENSKLSTKKMFEDQQKKIQFHEDLNEDLLYYAKQLEIANFSNAYKENIDLLYYKTQMTNYESTIQHLEKENEFLMKEVSALKDYKQAAKESMSLAKDNLSKLILKNHSLIQKYNLLEDQLSQCDKEKTVVQERYKDLERDYMTIKESNYQNKILVQENKQKVDLLEKANKSLQKQLIESQEIIENCRQQIEAHQSTEGLTDTVLTENMKLLLMSINLFHNVENFSKFYENCYEKMKSTKDGEYENTPDISLVTQEENHNAVIGIDLEGEKLLKIISEDDHGGDDAVNENNTTTKSKLSNLLNIQLSEIKNLQERFSFLQNNSFLFQKNYLMIDVITNVLQDCSNFREKFQFYSKYENKFVASHYTSNLFQTSVDSLQEKNTKASKELEVSTWENAMKANQILRLEEKLKNFDEFQQNYHNLENQIAKLSNQLQTLTMEKLLLEKTVTVLEKDSQLLKEKDREFILLEKKLFDKDIYLNDRENYISFLKKDFAEKLVLKDKESKNSSIYEDLCNQLVQRMVLILRDLFAKFENSQKTGEKVFISSSLSTAPESTVKVAKSFSSSSNRNLRSIINENLVGDSRMKKLTKHLSLLPSSEAADLIANRKLDFLNPSSPASDMTKINMPGILNEEVQNSENVLLNQLKKLAVEFKNDVLIDDNVSEEEKQKVLNLVEFIALFPTKVEEIIVFSNGIYSLRTEVDLKNAEIEELKLFCSKERRRISQHYEDQLLSSRDLAQFEPYG